MTAGAPLVVEPLPGRDGCGVGAERIARGVGLLRRHRHGEHRDCTSKKGESMGVHLAGLYHTGLRIQFEATAA